MLFPERTRRTLTVRIGGDSPGAVKPSVDRRACTDTCSDREIDGTHQTPLREWTAETLADPRIALPTRITWVRRVAVFIPRPDLRVGRSKHAS